MKKTQILTKAGVLLVAAIMVISVLPAVTADTVPDVEKDTEPEVNPFTTDPNHKPFLTPGQRVGSMKLDGAESFGVGLTPWYSVDALADTAGSFDPSNPGGWASIGATGATVYAGTWANDIWYAINQDTMDFGTIDTGSGSFASIGPTGAAGTSTGLCYDPSTGTMYAVIIDASNIVHLYTINMATGSATDIGTITPLVIGMGCDNDGNIYATSISPDSAYVIDPSGPTATEIGPLGVDLNYAQGAAFDKDNGDFYATAYTTAALLGIIDLGTGALTDLGAMPGEQCGFAIPYEGGEPGPQPGENCTPDVCDFAIDGFTDEFNAMSKGIDLDGDGTVDYYAWNSLPHEICIKIANRGEIGISEVKLLADVYEKVCGPTITVFNDPKYNIQEFPCCAAEYVWPEDADPEDQWIITDDGDSDSWVLQAYEFLTNGQSWRNTKGKDRSYGADEDVYLGLSDMAPPNTYDNLTTPCFDIAGVACADFEFSYWCEGEYTIDEDGNVVPADYGTIAYSLDCGETWTEVPKSTFVAYDTEDAWETLSFKFINTAIDEGDAEYMHPYSVVCDDCVPGEDDIVIQADLTDASLRVKFIWHKDPCLQFEGWYIDQVKVTKTLDYDLELVCQTHEIMEMEPCDGTVVWEDFCFPLACEFEDDTWYEVRIYAQVFDPVGCEADIENNVFKFQFKIEDIHDMACIDIEAISDTNTVPGETVSVNVTVQNQGTFGESNVPVVLKAGDLVKTFAINDDFEVDSLGDYSRYYWNFPEGATIIPWRWSFGDASISNIYQADVMQARSRNPGSECLVCAEEGTLPYLPEDTATIIAGDTVIDLDVNDNGVIDCDDPSAATLKFEAKWSIELEEYFYYYSGAVPTSLGSTAYVCILPTEGDASSYAFFYDYGIGGDADGYENDWVHVEFDLLPWIQGIKDDPRFDYDYYPAFQVGIFAYAEGVATEANMNYVPDTPDGGCPNALNPVPWSGFLYDNWIVEVISGENYEEVATVNTGDLLPGETEVLQMGWTSELCAHVLSAETQLPTDINPANDGCCAVETMTVEEDRCFDFFTDDMTGGGECLWHTCTNRENGDDYFAWAGQETDTYAQYVNNMDQSLVSPVFDISDYKKEGVAVNFTSYWEFAAGDFGEFQVKKGSIWETKKKFQGASANFEDISIVLLESEIGDTLQFRYRIVTNEEGTDEGWFIDDIQIFNLTDDGVAGSLGGPWYTWDAFTTFGQFPELDPLSWSSYGTTAPGSMYAGTMGPGGVWYCLENGAQALYAVDTGSGVASYIGPTGVSGSTSTGMGYDPSSDTMYAVMIDGANVVHVYEIDLGSGAATDLGTISPLIIGMGCDNAGNLYGTSISPDSAYLIDPAGPTATEIGPLGVDLNYAQGAAFDKDNGKFYASAYTASAFLGEVDLGTGTMTNLGAFASGEHCAFAIPFEEGGTPEGIVYGDPIPAFPWSEVYVETFERGYIEPWTCEINVGGQYWQKWTDRFDTSTLPNDETDYFHDICGCDEGWFVIPSQELVSSGYGKDGPGLNNAIAFELDLTDPLLMPYVEFCAAMNYDFSKETAYIEFSPDWDPEQPMETATWTTYWVHTPGDEYGSSTGGWKTLNEILEDAGHPDDRFVIDEYYGEKVYVRFRLVTDGNGAGIGEGWALDDVHLKVKRSDEVIVEDDEAPVTSIFFNQETAKVTLVAQDYPLNKGVGVDATYYIIDGGDQQTYGGPFTLEEGPHTVEYWSVDNLGNTEARKSASFTVDTTAPTVEIVSPEAGIYFLGNPILKIGSSVFAIGKLPVEAEATDAGSGVNLVKFKFSNGDSGIDDDGAPYEYTFRGMHFGKLTITVTAVDNVGLESSPATLDATVFSLGLL